MARTPKNSAGEDRFAPGTMYEVSLEHTVRVGRQVYRPGETTLIDGALLNRPEFAGKVKTAVERIGGRPRVPRKSLGEM